MKKFWIFLLVLFLFPVSVLARNRIDSIDQKIVLNQDGSANITEVWIVKGSDGTEWYKAVNGLDEETLTDFKVSMDGRALKYKVWDIDESLSDKSGYYGINHTDNGIELCFGKADYGKHVFTLSYKIKDYIVNTDDAQVLYWTLVDKLDNVDFGKFSAEISAYYSFPDSLDVWGYGYKGYAYVENGVIKVSNEENSNMNGNYVVVLVKFPLGVFNTEKRFNTFNTFDDVLDASSKGTFEYDYTPKKTVSDVITGIFSVLSVLFPYLIVAVIFMCAVRSKKYGFIGNKKITKDNTNMFREIPCDKDIYFANSLVYLNNFGYKETNILGAIILKWVREDKVRFINSTKGVFNKETSSIDLTLKPSFDNTLEEKLFSYMYTASKDGILESKELEKWCRNNYSKFFSLFQKFNSETVNKLKSSGDIRKRTDRSECKYVNVMSDRLYEESSHLFGLKLYLEEFASMNTKEVMEVKIWDEYLMFAYIFGIADKVAKQLKNLYPEVLNDPNVNYDYNTLIFINHISSKSVSAATSARSAAQSYSGGGGGFSSGGGGGGSFGGGGGGSR